MWIYIIAFVALVVLYKKFATEEIEFYYKYFMTIFCPSLHSLLILPLCVFRPKDVRNAADFICIGGVVTAKHLGINWIIRNPEILAEERGAIVVANHSSILDTMGICYFWKLAHKMTVVAKKGVMYAFPLGPMAYLCGVIFINKSNTFEYLKKITHALVKDKTKIFIFPEGTRSTEFPRLLPFKKGAFNIAVEAQVPIIPIVYSPYYFINCEKKFFRKGDAIMECLEPIPTVGLKSEDVPALTEKVRNIMQEAFTRLSKEVLDPLPKEYDCEYKLNGD